MFVVIYRSNCLYVTEMISRTSHIASVTKLSTASFNSLRYWTVLDWFIYEKAPVARHDSHCEISSHEPSGTEKPQTPPTTREKGIDVEKRKRIKHIPIYADKSYVLNYALARRI